MKRRTTAPTKGKKINRDRMGMPKIVMNPTPFISQKIAWRRAHVAERN
jgi:hypothetical protein